MDERIDKILERMDKESEEFRKSIRNMRREWGEIAKRMGTLVEDIVAPNIPHLAKKYFGCNEIDFFAVRVKRRNQVDKTKRREFDVIVVCEEDLVLLNETKSTVRIQDIDKFAEFIQSGEFFDYFPEYRGKKLIPIFSSLYISEDFVNYLTKQRIYALAMGEETMDFLNADKISI